MNSKPALDQARQILENLLGFLGFFVTIEEEDGPEGPTLQILTEEHDRLIGPRGQVLDDIQFLVNRLLCRRMEDPPRIRVDCEFYRSMREDKMLARAKEMADRVRATGGPAALSPMNSYYRRLIHNAFANDPDVMTESAKGDARFKRMFIKKRAKA
ncbi:MAG: single-stranded DNA-binding protein [Verrucomicrobiaceae bacterium]|nr:single-stranded DNA-binding protein [Verrucomicrobiaceae bacterium]